MRAWAVVEPGQPLQEIELPTPEPEGQQVLLEVTHCGVCHSDLHNWEGFYDLGGGRKLTLEDRGIVLPQVLGHEVVGRVVKLAPEASGVEVGDVRVVYPWVGCGTCDACAAEEDNMCLSLRAIGIYQHGGYGTHVLVPQARHLFDPGTVDPALAATYACSGITVYSAIRKAMPLAPDEPFVLFGAGGLGLNAIAMLRALEHENIIVVDVSAEKRAAASAAGATHVVDGTADDVAAAIIEAAGGPVLAIVGSGKWQRHCPGRIPGAPQGRPAHPDRLVWWRNDRLVAGDGAARADAARQLRRLASRSARRAGARRKWRARANADHYRTAGAGQRGIDAPARRHGDWTPGPHRRRLMASLCAWITATITSHTTNQARQVIDLTGLFGCGARNHFADQYRRSDRRRPQ